MDTFNVKADVSILPSLTESIRRERFSCIWHLITLPAMNLPLSLSQGFANESKSKSNVGPWILPFAAAYAAVAVAKVVAGGAKGRNNS